MKFFPVAVILFLTLYSTSCGNPSAETDKDSIAQAQQDSAMRADSLVRNNRSNIRDTVFHVALPPVIDGDIILINCNIPEANLLHLLMGGKYNHVGMIYTRKKDGILMVVEMRDSLRVTELTDFVDRADSGQVCLLRLKNANVTLNEEKTKSLITAAKAYNGRPFDPVLNWDDSHLYSSELIWKIYNNAMRLTICPTRTVADFDISEEEKAKLNQQYGLNVSDKDEAVSTDDIYNSAKFEIIYEK